MCLYGTAMWKSCPFSQYRGTEEYLDCKGRVDIINSTLGKALGGAAGEDSKASLARRGQHRGPHLTVKLGHCWPAIASIGVQISQWKQAEVKLNHKSQNRQNTESKQSQTQESLFHSENGLNTVANTRVLISQWKRALHSRKHKSPYFTVKTGSTQSQTQESLFHSETGLNAST